MPDQVIGAVVLAAGQSKRMGKPKMVLPWGGGTVIQHIVDVLLACEVSPVVVVTGGAADRVIASLRTKPVILSHNENFATTEMLESLQIGIRSVPGEVDGVLIALGDQPQIQPEVVRGLIHQFVNQNSRLVVPSYQLRRGHPWLLERELCESILKMRPGESMRTFLSDHEKIIDYLLVNTSSILADLDTPEDYERDKPSSVTD